MIKICYFQIYIIIKKKLIVNNYTSFSYPQVAFIKRAHHHEIKDSIYICMNIKIILHVNFVTTSSKFGILLFQLPLAVTRFLTVLNMGSRLVWHHILRGPKPTVPVSVDFVVQVRTFFLQAIHNWDLNDFFFMKNGNLNLI